ncbi:hypothetical protein [Mucilaginibacter sp. BT774]|uniref:hypothetical protein n=1 Tax=Mucilaginibacter sp. BT774 TaxID=3062276 RepID=UPI0026762C8B|nr:hypothetical protein [Mucilaginibacter sp. BT774]MDO3628977.1 hypothetical protein [Mucilaginibacter sp. BT774]
MQLTEKLKIAIEEHPDIVNTLKSKNKGNRWEGFTRTHFNLVAKVISRQITKEVLVNPDLVEMNLIIGKHNLEKQMRSMRASHIYDFIKYLGALGEYRVFNWISGKTLQSYWSGGDAKYVKVNALTAFLQIPFTEWDDWQKTPDHRVDTYSNSLSRLSFSGNGFSRSSLAIVKSYYLGNYFLYYPKTDGSRNIVKTPFVLKELDNGQIVVRSVSEGHRYSGKVIGIRDGCLYINCQNLDFEEMEQYVFNIGLETKPEVLFGVSTTVSVRNRRPVALKNILVKQTGGDKHFDNIPETEISFDNEFLSETEEAIIVNYFKHTSNNIITTNSCRKLHDVKNLVNV